MPVAANPILWSDVPELSNVDSDEHMILLKKVSTSPDVTEWRRYKIGDYFQDIENKFEQLKALLAPPESNAAIPVCLTAGISVTSGTIEWHRILNRVFVKINVSLTSPPANTYIITISGLPYPPSRGSGGIGILGNTGLITQVTVSTGGSVTLTKLDASAFSSIQQVTGINFFGSYEI